MIVIGKGLIAKTFEKIEYIDSNCIIFASGVSNSNENNELEFNKEVSLLKNTINNLSDKKLIYFSSIFINTNNPYYKHKSIIEKIIQNGCKNYLIIRLPQLIGNGGNPKNIFNFFKEKIQNNEELSIIMNCKRSLIDVEDIKNFVFYCLDKNLSGILNFAKIESISVLNLAKIIAKNLKKDLKYVYLYNKEKNFNFKNSPEVIQFIENKKIKSRGYIAKTIKKYSNHD